MIAAAFAYHSLRCLRLPDKGYSRHFKFLRATKFPIAPLSEQRCIVAKIGSLSGKSKRAGDHIDHIPRLVEKYKQAILAAAFEVTMFDIKGRGSNLLIPIAEYVQNLDQGWSPKCDSEPAGHIEEWAVIKTTAIQPIRFNPNENKRLPNHLRPRPEIEIDVGDVHP
jgi:type I restriction enzyme, S subunit